MRFIWFIFVRLVRCGYDKSSLSVVKGDSILQMEVDILQSGKISLQPA